MSVNKSISSYLPPDTWLSSIANVGRGILHSLAISIEQAFNKVAFGESFGQCEIDQVNAVPYDPELLSKLVTDPCYIQFVLNLNVKSCPDLPKYAYLNALFNYGPLSLFKQKLDRYEPLTFKEIYLIIHHKRATTLMDKLQRNSACFAEKREVFSLFREMGQITRHPMVNRLCKEINTTRDEGNILVCDREYLLNLHSTPWTFARSWTCLSQGRVCHIGFLVRKEEEWALSHLNPATETHVVHAPLHPLTAVYLKVLKLDPSPLLRPCFSERTKRKLCKIFNETITREARVERQAIPLASIRQIIESRFSKKPDDDHLLQSGRAEFCSSYVAKVILLGIEAMNKELKRIGSQETIHSPFGDEIHLTALDTLRLINILQQKKLIIEPLLPEFVRSKIPTAPQLLTNPPE